MALGPVATFRAVPWKYPGPGGWVFVTLPARCAPPGAGAFGRIPALARIGRGPAWRTSAWKDRRGTHLPLPAWVRGALEAGDRVEIEIRFEY